MAGIAVPGLGWRLSSLGWGGKAYGQSQRTETQKEIKSTGSHAVPAGCGNRMVREHSEEHSRRKWILKAVHEMRKKGRRCILTQRVRRKGQHNGAESLVGQHNLACPSTTSECFPEAGKQHGAGASPESALRDLSSNLRISCQASVCR